MTFVASVLSAKLSRTGSAAGALFVLALGGVYPAVATISGPGADQPAIIEGPGRVVDGDTLDVGQTRVRLEGIDAPETAQTCRTATGEIWACGKVSAAFLRALVRAKDVACDSTGTDKYRRTLAICFQDGDSINEAMVRAGMAWAFVRYSKEYVAVEADARARKVGVWQGPAVALGTSGMALGKSPKRPRETAPSKATSHRTGTFIICRGAPGTPA